MASFNDLISEIRLTTTEIQNVSTAKDNLIKTIGNKADNNLLPQPKYHNLSNGLFLIGSYIRGTKISPLDDIDIFYVIGIANTTDGHWHSITDCSFCFGSSYLDDDNNISSKKILELIKKEISKTYSTSDIKRNNEAVNVFLSSYNAGFDIVPAFWISGSAGYYLIPDGGLSTKWKKSNPKLDVNVLNDLDNFHNNTLKNSIRIIKYWFRQKKIKSPRSYHIESLAYHIFNIQTPIETYIDALGHFFNFINYNDYLTSCPDPTNLSEPLSSGLSDEDIQKIVSEASNTQLYLKLSEEDFINYVCPELQPKASAKIW